MLDKKFIDLIRSDSEEMEKTGRLTPQVLNVIYEQGLFKLFVHAGLGGRMIPLPQALRMFEHASWIDGNFGWLISIGSGPGYFAAAMIADVAADVFKDPRAVIAGSGFPSGEAIEVDGGYRVSGEWKYCSGSTHATRFTVNCVIKTAEDTQVVKQERCNPETEDPQKDPTIRSFILRSDQVEIKEDWNAFGLKATSSHTIRVTDAFVPKEMTFDIFQPAGVFTDPIFTYPFVSFAETSFAAVAMGIAHHFLDEARTLSERNKEAWESALAHRYTFVAKKIDQAERRLLQVIERFYDVVESSWNKHLSQRQLDEQDQSQIREVSRNVAHVALESGQSVFPYLGIQAIMEDAPVNRAWRDLQTACQHTMLVSFEENEEDR